MPTLEVKSNAFKIGENIPAKYTALRDDISPQLSWSKPPTGTKELVLIMDDPDAPGETWSHWVVYGIPPDSTGLPENIPKKNLDPKIGKQAKNSWGENCYGGPSPPRGGPHRYFFRLYALDITLELKSDARRENVLKAMDGHIIAKGELMGKFERM